MTRGNTMLVVGATGVVGEAALHHFAAAPGWDVVGISRRSPEPAANGGFHHLQLDLTDAPACAAATRQLAAVTHVIFAAVAEQPGLVSGWRDREQMQLNLAMLSNLLDPLCESAPGLRHVALLQGAKAYGAHVGHTPPLPAREDAPRDPHENFYWLQEDFLQEKATQHAFHWTIFRPQVIIGAATGAAMNPLLPVVAYAAIRREEGKPFSYPGGAIQIAELVDAGLLSQAFEWAAGADSARNQVFNFTNGDVFAWRSAWPALAEALGVPLGPDEPMRLSQYLEDRSDIWDHIVRRENLRPLPLARFLGQSHHYADILMRADAGEISYPTLLSTIKLRQAGFAGCVDSHAALRNWIAIMRERRLIP
ncbi:SDR family oxidoreductase [Haliea sp. E17]|uniref:SDR family oxidoreductase n=1 Tax=Haliea sp. E17 TaxID=3401576 RepID=UPI003AAE9AF2